MLGQIQTRELTALIQQIHQALGSVKETRILCRESYFESGYFSHLLPLNKAQAENSFISILPRYINEVTAIALVLGLLALALIFGTGSSDIFITLGLFAVAAIRLLPSLTRIAGSLSSIRFYSANLNEIYEDLHASQHLPMESVAEDDPALGLAREIRFENITFSYENSPEPAVRELSLQIPALQSVAFVGASGAGKTTAVDLLLGLYPLSSGRITVDGTDIRQNLQRWQKSLGYVPQQIYLSDCSILENVAFGIPADKINLEAANRALHLAQLESFLQTLPEGIHTRIGEHGVRLSGGQRQRIGIARALYHDPAVLVMDEATAALDNETERAFMESLRNLSGQKTLILIAHRLSTVEHCDNIFFMKEGRLVAQGTYNRLLESSDDFRRLASMEGNAKPES